MDAFSYIESNDKVTLCERCHTINYDHDQVRRRRRQRATRGGANDSAEGGRGQHRTARYSVADALQCTPLEAEEQISRLEAFTSFAGEGKTVLALDDLQDPISSFKSDGFKAIKAYLTTDTAGSTEGNVLGSTEVFVELFSFNTRDHILVFI